VSDLAVKAKLVQQLTRFATQAEQLLAAEPAAGAYGAEELARWQRVYSDRAHQIIDDRDHYLAEPETTTVRDLELWCDYARRTLRHAPQPR
jgi:hypothetical protein